MNENALEILMANAGDAWRISARFHKNCMCPDHGENLFESGKYVQMYSGHQF